MLKLIHNKELWLTKSEVLREYGISRATLDRLCNSCVLTSVSYYGKVYVSVSDLSALYGFPNVFEEVKLKNLSPEDITEYIYYSKILDRFYHKLQLLKYRENNLPKRGKIYLYP